MEKQSEKGVPKSTKICVAIIIILLIASICTGYLGSEYIYNEGYKTGYSKGKDAGYGVGYTKGHSEGYKDAENDYNGNSSSSIIYGDYGTSYEDGITEYSVFVTPSGEKYHTEYCRYIEGKSNLSYYDSASDAAAAGYEPCSVCNP